jgi:hypothetical protein
MLILRIFDPQVRTPRSRPSRLFNVVVFLAYVGIVAVTAKNHEMWRDEVHALSSAQHGDSFAAMLSHLQDGHPPLWYLLLRAGDSVLGAGLVLPLLSGVVAASAVAVILRFAPFSSLQKLLLTFGMFLGFEYSVMCRNYGIGALALFVIAAQYAWRFERPVAWGLLLAILANTSIHAAIIALALIAGWGWDTAVSLRRRNSNESPIVAWWGVASGAVIAMAGVLISAWFSAPPSNSIIANVDHVGPRDIVRSATFAIINPGSFFNALAPLPDSLSSTLDVNTLEVVMMNVLFAGIVVGLWRRWSLLIAYVAAVLGTGVFYQIGYAGALRHQGILFMFLVVLYWRVLEEEQQTRSPPPNAAHTRRTFWALTIPMTLMLSLQFVRGQEVIHQDIARDLSSSKKFGAFLQLQENRSAIVMGEPDYYMDALPYYVSNRIYFTGRQQFGLYSVFTREQKDHLTLGEVLATADMLQTKTQCPILIALDPQIAEADTGRMSFAYGRSLSWSPSEREAFLNRTDEVAAFLDAIEENYKVYRLRPALRPFPGATCRD